MTYKSTNNPRDKHLPFTTLEKKNPGLRRLILFFSVTTMISLLGVIISVLLYLIPFKN